MQYTSNGAEEELKTNGSSLTNNKKWIFSFDFILI